MRFSKFFARKGAVGGTARWVAQGFQSALVQGIFDVNNFTTQAGLEAEIEKLVEFELSIRFMANPSHRQRELIFNRWTDLPGKGLLHFTEAILDVEAGYFENSSKNVSIFREIIEQELTNGKVGQAMISGQVQSQVNKENVSNSDKILKELEEKNKSKLSADEAQKGSGQKESNKKANNQNPQFSAESNVAASSASEPVGSSSDIPHQIAKAEEYADKETSQHTTKANHMTPKVSGRSLESGSASLIDPDQRYIELIAAARIQLADLSATFIDLKREIEANNAALFQRVGPYYKERDRLDLLIDYRKKLIAVLLAKREREAENVFADYARASAASDQEYESVRKQSDTVTNLSDDEKSKIRNLFKKLAKLFHPDHYILEPNKQQIYDKLMAKITEARENGDLGLLEEIAIDADAYIRKQGWQEINIKNVESSVDLKNLYKSLQIEIEEVRKAIDNLRKSSEYELAVVCSTVPERLQQIAESQSSKLKLDIKVKRSVADRLKLDLEKLTDQEVF